MPLSAPYARRAHGRSGKQHTIGWSRRHHLKGHRVTRSLWHWLFLFAPPSSQRRGHPAAPQPSSSLEKSPSAAPLARRSAPRMRDVRVLIATPCRRKKDTGGSRDTQGTHGTHRYMRLKSRESKRPWPHSIGRRGHGSRGGGAVLLWYCSSPLFACDMLRVENWRFAVHESN